MIQLNVTGNKDLLSLPATLRNLSKLTQISVDENIRYPPASIARKGSDGIRAFYARFDGLVPFGVLDLSKLHLESIPYDAIDARSLGNIILSHNPLGLHQMPLRNVELLGTVMCLELAFCDLQALQIEMALLSCLQRLNLQNNMLSVVDDCVLQMTAMVNLDLSCNLLRSIAGLFSALSELIACDLSSNKIVFHENDFQGASHLQSLNMSKNSVEMFPESIGCMVNVERCIERQRVGLGAVVVLRRHDLDFHSWQAFQRVVEGDDAFGAKAIVVGNENFHTESCKALDCRGQADFERRST